MQEAVLKEPLRRIKSLGDIAKGHSLLDYYTVSLTSINKLSQSQSRTLDTKNMLQPCQNKDGFLYVQTRQDRNVFTLSVIGSFLQNVQLDATSNDFQGLPFKESSLVSESFPFICH